MIFTNDLSVFDIIPILYLFFKIFRPNNESGKNVDFANAKTRESPYTSLYSIDLLLRTFLSASFKIDEYGMKFLIFFTILNSSLKNLP